VASTVTSGIEVPAGLSVQQLVLSAYSSSLDATGTGKTPAQTALAALQTQTARGAVVLLEEHVDGWRQLWENRIEVEGDVYLASAVNASLYFILSSIREDWPHGLSPGGLASGGYHGHTCVSPCLQPF
jgi:trehalose/maltose hydrolase-like predicted phosphorylase